MKAAVIGGGAVGLLCAGRMVQAGVNVKLFVRRTEQARLLQKEGLAIHDQNGLAHTRFDVDLLIKGQSIDADLIIVAVKQYHLQQCAETIYSCLSPEGNVLFVQNGMGHLNVVEQTPCDNIYVGVVEHGVLKESDARINHTGIGTLKLAAYRGSVQALHNMWNKLDRPDFTVTGEEDWYKLLTGKLLVNAALNPLTALYRVENGALLENSHFIKTMQQLFAEAFSVLNLPREDKEPLWHHVVNVCRTTAKNRSSMLRDIENGSKTEIEAISGYLLSKANEAGIILPYTSFVYESILGLETPRTPDSKRRSTG